MRGLDGVIFDWGGVLIEDPSGPLITYLAAALQVSPRAFEQAFALCGHELQLGILQEDQFWARVCDYLARPRPISKGSLWGQAFRTVYRPRPEMLLIAERLKMQGLRTAVLSNTEPACARFFGLLGYRCIDLAVFSCQVHLVKPDPEIFRLAVSRLGTHPARTLFIDDKPQFVRAASAIGLTGEVYQGIEQIRAHLAGMGIWC